MTGMWEARTDVLAASELKNNWTSIINLLQGAAPILMVASYIATGVAAVMLFRFLRGKFGKGGGEGQVKLGWGFVIVLFLMMPSAVGWVLGLVDWLINLAEKWGNANL
jgi:hypothetical protein